MYVPDSHPLVGSGPVKLAELAEFPFLDSAEPLRRSLRY